MDPIKRPDTAPDNPQPPAPHQGDVPGQPVQPTPEQQPPIQDNPTTHHTQQNHGKSIKLSANGWFTQVKGVLSFAAFIGGVLLAAFLINQFVFQSYFVEGTSMVPTLQNNDRLIIEKVGKSVDGIMGKPYIPNRGDIVVLDSSIVTANGSNEQLIKRVIGLPGDKIHIQDGKVTVTNQQEPDGFNVDERLGLKLEQTYAPAPQDFTVPEGKVFVMGDNRTQNGSHDSRAFGPVDPKDLEGKLWARILPVDQARLFPSIDSSKH